MTDEKSSELESRLREWRALRRRLPPLSFRDLEDYREGRLSTDDEELVREYLADSPESIERLRWLEDSAAGRLPELPAETAEPELLWRPETAGRREKVSDAVLAIRWRNLTLLAASLLIFLSIALAWLALDRGRLVNELEEAREAAAGSLRLADVNTPILYVTGNVRNGSRPELSVAAGATAFVLVFEVPPDPSRSPQAAYAIDVVAESGEVVWRAGDLRLNRYGNVVVTLTRELFPSGSYDVRLFSDLEEGREAVIHARLLVL